MCIVRKAVSNKITRRSHSGIANRCVKSVKIDYYRFQMNSDFIVVFFLSYASRLLLKKEKKKLKGQQKSDISTCRASLNSTISFLFLSTDFPLSSFLSIHSLLPLHPNSLTVLRADSSCHWLMGLQGFCPVEEWFPPQCTTYCAHRHTVSQVHTCKRAPRTYCTCRSSSDLI